MNRHSRQSCKADQSEDAAIKQQLATQERKINTLTALVARLAVGREAPPEPREAPAMPPPIQVAAAAPQFAVPPTIQVAAAAPQIAVQANHGPVVNVQQNITIAPWDGTRRLSLDVAKMAAAYAENPKLQDYAQLGDHEMAESATVRPYVAEILVDLTRRAHAEPSARNVHLNPRRADQALVYLQSGRWEVMPLSEASRLLLDGVVGEIRRITRLPQMSLGALPHRAQNALSMAGVVYSEEPDEIVKRAKPALAAHLTNCQQRPTA